MTARPEAPEALELATGAMMADTITALADAVTGLAGTVGELDGRTADTLRLVAAACDRLEQAARAIAAHRAELDRLELKRAHLEARLGTLEGRHDHTAVAVIDHLTVSHGQDITD